MVGPFQTLGELRQSGARSRPVKQEIRDNLVRKLQALYDRDGTAFRVEELAGGFQLLTRPEFHSWLLRLRRTYAVQSPQIRHLMLTLRDEADSRNAGGLAFVEAVTAGLGHLLVRHAGVVQPRPVPVRGGLSAVAKRRVLELIDAALDARLTIEMLAREVELSPAHFARAFKETLGRAPHQYLLARRLERARRLLETTGATLSDIAQRTGFADQAHFTRLFKRAFGTTPGALARTLH